MISREELSQFIKSLGKVDKEDKKKFVATYLSETGDDVEKILEDINSY